MPECSEQIKLNKALRDKNTQCVMQQTSLKNQLAALQQRKAATAEELHDCQNDRRDMDAKLSLQASVYEKQKAEGQREVDRQQDLVDNLLHQLKVSSIKHNTSKADMAQLQKDFADHKLALAKAKNDLQLTIRQADGCATILNREKRQHTSLRQDYDKLMTAVLDKEDPGCQCPVDLEGLIWIYLTFGICGVLILVLLSIVSYLAVANHRLRRQPSGGIPLARLNNDQQDDGEDGDEGYGPPPQAVVNPHMSPAAQALQARHDRLRNQPLIALP